MKNKSEELEKFKECKLYFKNYLEWKIKCLRTDSGTEFPSQELTKFLKENGIGRRFTTLFAPQQNGIAECINRT